MPIADHAFARTTDGDIPLIGIPPGACQMDCDLCGDQMYWLDTKLNEAGNQFLCLKCRSERIGLVGKYPLLLDP